jgi:DNA-binding beta-propeller fold protein YncE
MKPAPCNSLKLELVSRAALLSLSVLSLASLESRAAAAVSPARSWPPPPAKACIVYVRSISTPADVGAKPAALSRVSRWLTGAKAESASLMRPFGLAVDDSGNLLVTDTGSGAVCCLEFENKKWRRWEQVGDVRFESPVAVARQGNTIFVAESASSKVIAFDLEGRKRFEIIDKLERPSGLAVAGGRLYIADAHRHCVVITDLKGQFITEFGHRGASPGEFNFPTHVAVDATGLVYVTDSLNYRVEVFGMDGKFLRAIGSAGDAPGHFSRPKGVAVDTAGHAYVVDALFDNVQIFDTTGRLLLDWGQSGSEPGEFWLPNAIAINAKNEIYVADSYNRRIQVFRYMGEP